MEKTKTILRTLKYFALFVVLAFCLPIFSACGEETIPVTSLSLVQKNYTIKQGDEIQLEVKILPLEATNKIVRYSLPIGDTDADKRVTVSETGLVQAKVIDDKKTATVKVYAVSDYGNFRDICSITIVGEIQTLQTPTDLTYDAQTSNLTWSSVTAKDNFVTYNPKYCLRITKDGEELPSQVLGTTNFKVTEAGHYEVSVQSVVTEDDYTTLYENSPVSDSYSFDILPNVTEAKVVGDKITATTTGRVDVSYELQLFKTSFQGEKTIRGEKVDLTDFVKEENQNTISWAIPQDFEAGTYEFEIITKGNDELRLFDSREFVAVSLEKLSAPADVLFSGGMLSWKKVSSAKNYKIFVWSKATTSSPTPYLLKEITNGYTEENGRFSIDISQQEIEVSPYTIKIQSLGDGGAILNSVVQNIEINKLATPINLKIEGNTLSWSPVENATSYEVYVNGRNPYTNDSSSSNYKNPEKVSPNGNGTITLDCSSMKFVADGEFEDAQNVNVVTVVACSSYYDENNKIVTVESVTPARLEIHKIAKVVLKNSYGDVGWDSVDGATRYHINIKFSKNNKTTTIVDEVLPEGQQTYLFSDNTLTKEAGKYIVTVRGIGDGFKVRDGDEIVVDDSNENDYTFIKQSAPIIKSFDSNGVLKWETGEFSLDTTYYQINVYDTTEQTVVETFRQMSISSYDLSGYLSDYVGCSQYRFYVNATNDVSSLKYLNSENSEIVTPYKIGTPQNLRISNGKFVWDKPTNVESSFESLLDYEFLIAGKNKIQMGSYGAVNYAYEPSAIQMSAGGTSAVSIKTYVKQNSESESPNKVTLSDGKTVVYLLDSSYSAAQNFSRLSKPSNPSIEKDSASANYQRLVGKTIENASEYEFFLFNENNNKYTTGQTVVCNNKEEQWCIEPSLLFPSERPSGTYYVTVKALGGNDYINSPESTGGAKLCKLDSPTLNLVDGVLYWEPIYGKVNSVSTEIKNYQITYRNTSQGNTNTLTVSDGTSWDMKGISAAEYGITITALGFGGNVISSSPSVEALFTKLGQADASSLRINKSSTSVNEESYNTIIWDSVGQAQYRVKVYQISGNNEELKYNEVQQNASFVFDDSFSSSEYTIQIQTVNEGQYVNGDISNKVKIKRLNTVQGIGVSGTSSVVQETSSGNKELVKKNYLLTWDKVDGASAYTVSVKKESGGSTPLKTITDDNTSMYLIDSTVQNGTLDDFSEDFSGQLTITIIAKISGDELTQKNGVLTISSATSSGKQIYRNKAPKIVIQNGKITWTKENNQDNGHMLVFSPQNSQLQTVFIPIESGTYSYDMSSTELADISSNTYYNLSVIAVGTENYYIQSRKSILSGTGTVNVGKLATITEIQIVDGVVQWTASEFAQSYVTVATSSSNVKQTYTGITREGDSNVIKLPSNAFKNLDGEINFTIQAIGSAGFSDEEYVYINSIVTDRSTFKVTKLKKPDDLYVENGEIDWYRDLTNNNGSYHVSGYKVEYQMGTTTKTQEVGREEAFLVSDYIGSRTNLSSVRIYAMGTANGGNGDFVSSDYSNSMSVEICGMPQNLTVSEGILVWKEDDSDNYSYHDYEIEITFEDDKVITLKSTTNSNSLAEVMEISHKFKKIRVRHYGTANSKEQQSIAYVNSKYSNYLENVIKLDEITDVQIDDNGVISWGSDYAYEKAGIVLSVGNTKTQTTERENIDINSDEIETSISKNGSAELSVSYYAYVPDDKNTRYEGDTTIPLYLYSEANSFKAIKFAPVNSCTLSDDGLQLSWEMNLKTVSTSDNSVSNDKIVLVYQQSEYKTGEGNVNLVTEKTKEVLLSEATQTTKSGKNYYSIPLWDLGYYNFKVYVVTSNTKVKAMRSAPVELSLTFDKFSAGNGTAENPFVIKSTLNESQEQDTNHAKWIKHRSSALTKFYYIKTIPSCFFRLEEDIELETKTETNTLVNNFSLTSQFVTPFTGGINGMGADGTIHTIKNFRIYNGCSLFNTIEGGTNASLSGQTPNVSNFYAQRGVLMNLNLEVAQFSYGMSTSSDDSLYLAVIAKKMIGGLLANCQISADLEAYPDGVKIQDYGTQPIVFGTFVAQVYGTEEYQAGNTVSTKNSYRNTTITNCTSNFGISILKSSDQSSRITKIAGIAGECYGTNIYNCTNKASLSANQVAGITLKTTSISTYELVSKSYEQKSISSVVSGCSNEALLNAYTINNNGKVDYSYSGGIVGDATNTFVVNCLNSGNINVSTIESYLGISTSGESTAVVGGIVGTQKASTIDDSSENSKFSGGIINCINVGEMIFTKSAFKFGSEIADGPTFVSAILGTTENLLNVPKNSYYDGDKNSSSKMISGTGNSDSLLSVQSKTKAFLTSSSEMSAEGVMATELAIADFLSSDANPTHTSIAPCFYSTLYLQKAQFTFADGSYPKLVQNVIVKTTTS